jgi:hypothetical protein
MPDNQNSSDLVERLRAEAGKTRYGWTTRPTMNPPSKPVHSPEMKALLTEAADTIERLTAPAMLNGVEGLVAQLRGELAHDKNWDYTAYETGRIAEKERCIALLESIRAADNRDAAGVDAPRWIDDCQGKASYDGAIVSVEVRTWPGNYSADNRPSGKIDVLRLGKIVQSIEVSADTEAELRQLIESKVAELSPTAVPAGEVDHLALANKVTKALFPDLYGKPGLTQEQVVLLMGSRQIIMETLANELPTHPPAAEVREVDASCVEVLRDLRGLRLLNLYASADELNRARVALDTAIAALSPPGRAEGEGS